jgi:hypothetical protein
VLREDKKSVKDWDCFTFVSAIQSEVELLFGSSSLPIFTDFD